MTATNHMLTGAVVAAGVQQPLLVAVLALASHFVLDMLPHFGVHEKDTQERNQNPLFKSILAIDIALVVASLIFVPLVLRDVVSPWLLLLGMLLAWIPDAVWVQHFLAHERHGRLVERGRFAKFHQRIQWFERPVGLISEVLLLGGLGALIVAFVS